MRHAFVDVGPKTMCSRCGNEVFRVDEDCPAVSDGEMYSRNPAPDASQPAGRSGRTVHDITVKR